MNLATLVRDAAAGGATLSNADGSASISLDVAARLYGAVAADVDYGGFGGTFDDDLGRLPVALESAGQDEAVVNLNGIRYLLDLEPGGGAETVVALCEAPGCPTPALSPLRAARVCGDHQRTVTPLARFLLGVPLAGDDRGADWEERAADEIRERRLAAIEQQIERDEELVARSRSRLERLRGT